MLKRLLFGLVFGFSNAETHGWGEPLTVFALVGGASLLVLFVWLEAHVDHPLLPLRVVLDRDRGGSYLAIGITVNTFEPSSEGVLPTRIKV